jgi:hypothetical protein
MIMSPIGEVGKTLVGLSVDSAAVVLACSMDRGAGRGAKTFR